MIVGNPSVFAIESGITQAYERLSFRAIGYFVIHVASQRYGVFAPDATMLACSFDEVGRRIVGRGKHTSPLSSQLDAADIACAFRNAVFGEEPNESYFGIPLEEFGTLFNRKSNRLLWAPDGDEAFDDRSYVLQLDVKNRVRLIAFKAGDGFPYDPATLSDMWLPADEFYGVLGQWYAAFEREWTAAQKISKSQDGADFRQNED
jgi:hypothetical protein